jgi:exopolysaccharide biosynthesis predicted pyruvyltransferase EpsI
LYTVTTYATKRPMNISKASIKQNKKSVMSPFDSYPPKSIPLNVTNDLRHACLNELRNHRHSFYLPYIQQAQHILLVDPAYHSNVGDHMITIAELELLKNVSTTSATSTSVVSQCSYVQAHNFVPSCDDILPLQIPNRISLPSSKADVSDASNTTTTDQSSKYKVALWHGGGNFGNLWSTAQQARIHSIVLLLQANYTIIGMPNSWYFTIGTE